MSDPVTEYLSGCLESYLADLHQLVSIDSGSYNKAGVDAVGREMEQRLLDLGCGVTRLPNAVLGDSLVARMPGSGVGKVVMVGHLDTVYPDGTAEQRPFTIADGRVHGPGVADMKNGILSALYAMRALKATGNTGFQELVLFLNPDEEIGSPSSGEAIDQECAGATAAFVLESARPDGSVVVGRKGVYHYTLTARGRSAHAGVEPEKGRSAIHELAHKIVALSALNGLSEGTTVNVGTVQGGMKSNVVADYAMCEVDIRVRTVAAFEELDRELRRIVSQPSIPDTQIEVQGGFCFPPMERNERNEALFQRVREVAASRLGLRLTSTETGGGSDANHISAAGIPVLDGLGPIGGAAHSPNEYLVIGSIVERTSLLAHAILELGKSPIDT